MLLLSSIRYTIACNVLMTFTYLKYLLWFFLKLYVMMIFGNFVMLSIMVGILEIYGLMVETILNQRSNDNYGAKYAYTYLASGICYGLSFLDARFDIYIGGDDGVRALGQTDKILIDIMLILIFAEVLGLYGLIVSLILSCIYICTSN